MSKIEYEFDEAKSKKLRKERGLGFEEIITIMESQKVLESYDHPNFVKYPTQQVSILKIEEYVWLVISEKRENVIRLITLYQSRKETKKRLKGFKNVK
jgi:uncharacterized DUF497 family protein